MSLAARPLASRLSELTPLWAQDHALDHRNLVIADEAGPRLATADAMAIEGGRTASRVVIAVADAAAVEARLDALRARGLGALRLVGASEGSHADDRAIVRGTFDLLVISIQRLGDLLTRAPALAEGLGLVIVDGAEALLDPARSPALDRALTLLRISALPPRIVALCAADADDQAIARWLDASVRRGAAQLDLSGASAETLPELDLAPILLAMTVAGRIGHVGELRRLLLTSFAGHAAYRRLAAAGDPREGFSQLLDAALDRCLGAGVVAHLEGRGLVATEAGRIALALGLDVATIASLDRWVRSLATAAPSRHELALELARTTVGAQAPAPQGGAIDYRAAALASARALGVGGRPVFRWLSEEIWSFGQATDRLLRQAAVVDGLLSEQRLGDLADHHGASPATLRAIASAFARPLLAVVALLRQRGRPAAEADALLQAARRLDPTIAALALQPAPSRPRATPPAPVVTRAPRAPRASRKALPPRGQQVALFGDLA
ncbi:MAG: hypothetical protein H6710_16125 [Myxococcales bacterium]|nr:hypothetical protein [Myxococcales bacterium]